ncbi:MAG: hypothetical protein IH595_14325 [Bacteroidales bacterium]|nr:hypothetical protein [Bacteroidales bacterium]
MKNRAILLLLGLMISSSFVFGQASKDTLQKDSIYSQYKGYFSAEQSWQISEEAYKKQLEAAGLSENEIKQKVQEFEKQKEALIERIKKQLKSAEKQRQLAEIQRQQADTLRQEAKKLRQQFEEQQKQAGIERGKASEQRRLAEIERKMAENQRKEAEVQRTMAEEQRKLAKEWKNTVQSLLHENITMSGKDSKSKYVKLKIAKRNTLFFNVSAVINSGNVLIEIFNPKGQKEGELSLEHREGSTTKTDRFSGNTSGSLNKIINSPETGDWEVKVKPKKSKGHIIISVTQHIKPAI